jgi:hypothetical protein
VGREGGAGKEQWSTPAEWGKPIYNLAQPCTEQIPPHRLLLEDYFIDCAVPLIIQRCSSSTCAASSRLPAHHDTLRSGSQRTRSRWPPSSGTRWAGAQGSRPVLANQRLCLTPATCPHPFHDSAILAQGKALLTNRAAQPDGLWALSMLCRGTDVACLSKPLLRGELAFAGMAQRSRMFSPLNTLIC